MLKGKTFLNKTLAVAFVCLALVSCNNQNTKKTYSEAEIKENSKKVNEFFDQAWKEELSRDPEKASVLGIKTNYDKWTERSEEAFDKNVNVLRDNLNKLKNNFNLQALDEETKLSVALYEDYVNDVVQGASWRYHAYFINQMEGVHADLPTFMINVHKIDTITDANAYISRLDKMDVAFDQVIKLMQTSESKGIIPPHFTFAYVSETIKNFIETLKLKDDKNVLYTDFKTKIAKLTSVSAEQANSMAEQVYTILSTKVLKAYQRLSDYWTALEKKAKTDYGIWALPKGGDYYKYCLQHHTTTNMTPDQVYETGVSEVKRIQDEMRKIMKQVNFPSDDLQAFFEFMRTDKQFKYTNDDAGHKQILAESNNYIDNIKTRLDSLFQTKPKAPCVVMEVEKFREKSAGGAFYEQPSLDGSRPGRFYVNNYNMDDEPRYQMEALCYHEAIPGHHMQITIAQELQGLPEFRKQGGNTAYVEGWALYSELLGKEVGFYQDPYSDFGRLSMEIFRAARLVVDVGIHVKKWTYQQALDYFLKNTANAPGDCKKEIERYFLWPGQATGYKVGMMKILDLREQAKKAMGAKFNIRVFHDLVLTHGPLPLRMLEDMINSWSKK